MRSKLKLALFRKFLQFCKLDGQPTTSVFRNSLCTAWLLAGILALMAPSHAGATIGAVYVVNGTTIEIFSTTGVYQSAFGGTGSGNGQFQLPSGITTDISGHVWVTDAILNRVQEFSAAGTYMQQFGSIGSAPGLLYHPYGIALDSAGNVWVADTGNNRIQQFGPTGTYLQSVGGLGGGNGQFNSPIGITTDISNNIWVSDTGNNRIEKFSATVNGAGSASTVAFSLKFGSYGNGNGQFRGIFAISADASGNLWVADSQNQRLQQFGASGNFLQAVLGPFSYPSPYGITVDPSSNVWAVDYNTNQVMEFNSSGAKLQTFGTTGGGTGQLYHPTYIAIGQPSS